MEGFEVQIHGSELRRLARRCGIHQQLGGSRGPQPAAVVPRQLQPGDRVLWEHGLDYCGGSHGVGRIVRWPLCILPAGLPTLQRPAS